MKWTKERPTKPGWYWMRAGCDYPRSVVQVYEMSGELRYTDLDLNESRFIVTSDKEWAGPVVEPDES